MSYLGSKVRSKQKGFGFCDRSGSMYNLCDLKKQMEWRGNNLTWTGLMVGPDQLDRPNPQFKPFKAKKEDILPAPTRPQTNITVQFYGQTLSTNEVLAELRESLL